MLKRFVVFCLILLATATVAAQIDITTETPESPGGGATAAMIWVNTEAADASLILGTDDDAGLGVYNLDGDLVQFFGEDGPTKNGDLRYNVPVGDDRLTLIAVGADAAPRIIFYTVRGGMVERLNDMEIGIEHNGLCLYHSALTDTHYVIVLSEDGDLEQYALDGSSGEISGELRREINIGGEAEGCVADDELGNLFIGEEVVGVWKYGAEPESGFDRQIIELSQEGNELGLGVFDEDIEGLTIYYAADGEGYLIVANEAAHEFVVFERGGDNALIGTFTLNNVEEPNGIDVVNVPVGMNYADGLFASSNDDGGNFVLVGWQAIADQLDLITDTSYNLTDTGQMMMTGMAAVTSLAETDPVPSGTDAADDPAIWIHPEDTGLSTVIGTDKTSGLVVYDLDGNTLQSIDIGDVNNVDVRYNFPLADETVALVAATNRTFNSLVLYAVNPQTRELYDVAARDIISDMQEVYGFCMYHSAMTGDYYAIINSADTGEVEQYRLFDDGMGRVDAELVREFVVGQQTEGCVADDELGNLFIGEETAAIWKYGAEPDAGDERVLVDSVENGNFTADVEGLAIYYGSDGSGYLIASSQGSSEFVIYDRTGDHSYIGRFSVVEAEGVDAVSGTDGLDVTNAALGDAFPEGLFVAQDDTNINPDENQNFKLVSWGDIAEALGLMVDTGFDPRNVGRME